MNRLAPYLIWNTDDCCFQHCRVGIECILDLDTVDVFAAGDNHIFGSIDYEEEVFLIDGSQVTCVIPSVYDGCRSCLRHAPVPKHDVGTASNDFADFSWFHVFPIGVDNAYFDAK